MTALGAGRGVRIAPDPERGTWKRGLFFLSFEIAAKRCAAVNVLPLGV